MTAKADWIRYWLSCPPARSTRWAARLADWRCHPEDDNFSHLAAALTAARTMAADSAAAESDELLAIILCLSHSEELADQDSALKLLELLRALPSPGLAERDDLEALLRERREVIDQFQRFPARNRRLGRASTPTEAYFMLGAGQQYG